MRSASASNSPGVTATSCTQATTPNVPTPSKRQPLLGQICGLTPFLRSGRGVLRSDAFKELPAESSNEGIGGCSYFIEVDIGGIYSWKCHWSPGDQVFLDIAKVLECLSRDAETIGLRDAETENRDSLTRTPVWSDNHYRLGYSLKKQGKFAEAIKHYEQAVRLDPKDCYARAGLASSLMQQGKVQEAIEHLVQALTLSPKHPDALYNLGRALERAGRVQEAEEQYEQALRMYPEFIEAHISSENSLLRQGKPQEAIPYYEQALRINPYYTQIHFNLGRALEQVGRVPEAIEQYEQALSCRPDLMRARNALTRLRAAQ
jgi:tetratricopeptide (TPR) repeat protein